MGENLVMKDATILRTKVPARRLQRAERILRKLGLTPADAVNMLLAQIEIHQGLPFEVNSQPKPLLSAEEQATVWTETYGAY
jgi:addiction module RelB/DinJ family antitoxin